METNLAPIRVGIIGSGFAAYTHVLALQHIPGVLIAGLAGGTRAPALAARVGCRWIASVDALIDAADITAVIVCSPHFVHAEQTIRALRQGKHVLVEKPMATSVEACRRMIAEAKQADRQLMVGHFQRYRTPNAAAKTAIAQDTIGRVVLIQDTLFEQPSTKPWENDPRACGFLLGYGIHAIDRVLWWKKPHKVCAVYGLSRSVGQSPVEHISSVSIEFDDQSVATITTSNRGGGARPEAPGAAIFQATVIGEQGSLEVDAYRHVLLHTPGSSHVQTLAVLPGWSSLEAPERLRAYIAQDEEFIAAIREQRSPAIDGAAGMRNVQVALAAYESSRTRQVVYPSEVYSKPI